MDARIKVLIVDDQKHEEDKVLVHELANKLEEYGLLAVNVKTNIDAFKALKSDADIHVILLDYVLKNIDEKKEMNYNRQ